MTAVYSFIGFALLWIVPSLLSLSFARCVVSFVFPATLRTHVAEAGLAPAVGVALFLVVFSLTARVFPYYPAAYFVSLSVMAAMHLFFRRRVSQAQGKSWVSIFMIFVLFICLQLFFWMPRILFSDVHFNPSQYGAEKLFNLSLQQSFTYGTGYPPESLWLAGEREVYYILPRIIPGLASWFSVHFFAAPAQISGVFFHLSDAFYNSLAVLTLGTLACLLLLRAGAGQFSALLLGGLAGIFPFLAAPFRVFRQIAEGKIDFWSLSRIIPFTINEYPFWNFSFADNHAHNNAAFLDVLVWFLTFVILFRGIDFSRIEKISLGLLLGFCSSALLMSQTGSAFIVVVVFALPVVLSAIRFVRLGRGPAFLESLAWPAGFALLFSLPDIMTRPRPRVLWNVVPPRLASSAADFSSVHFALIIFLAVCLLFVKLPQSLGDFFRPIRWFVLTALSALLLFALAGFPVPLIAAVFCMAACLPSGDFQKSEVLYARLVALSIFVLMVFPEFVGINFDMGADYIRFNTSFKFLYTAFFAIPLSLVFLVTLEPFQPVATMRLRIASVAALFITIVFAAVQVQTLVNRMTASHPEGGLSGLEFLDKQRPPDAALIRSLNSAGGRVVLIEACGMPPRESAYTVAGRISAYSGRPSLCGWGMHSFLHREIMEGSVNSGRHVWDYLNDVDSSIVKLYAAARRAAAASDSPFHSAFEKLKKLGATHLVFGEYEKALHPESNLKNLAALSGGKIIFQSGEYGIIDLRN